MKSKTSIFLSVFFATVFLFPLNYFSYAQPSTSSAGVVPNNFTGNLHNFKTLDQLLKIDINSDVIEGSPYTNEAFVKGEFTTIDNSRYSDLMLRYNVFYDRMEFKLENDSVFFISEPEKIRLLQIENTNYVYLPKTKNNGGYFELKYDQRIKLLIKNDIDFLHPTKKEAYLEDKAPRFKRNPDKYYIQTEENSLILISNKKNLYEAFTQIANELKTYLKKEKINLRKEDDLLKLMVFLNDKI